jgi:hypothetical protein
LVAWTCDDAFISFRYARNLVEGQGLVFNPGDRVEGFTNLLWTLWSALGLALGVHAEAWSISSGLVAYVGAVALLVIYHFEIRAALGAPKYGLPLAALICALHPDYNIYATSGLETSAFTTLSLAGCWVVARGLTGSRAQPLLGGCLYGAVALLRPDGVVFALVAGAAILALSRERWRETLVFGGAFLFIWGSATLWRLHYYGQYFPNTYYAKSASQSWYTQGISYFAQYLHKYWVLALGPFLVAVSGIRRLRAQRRTPSAADVGHLAQAKNRYFAVQAGLSTAMLVAYGFYVVRVGGDFMYARVLIPVTPYLALLCELGWMGLAQTRPLAYWLVSAAMLITIRVIPRPVTDRKWVDGVADEWEVYTPARVELDEQKARTLAKYFRRLPVRLAFLGSEARCMYNARIPIAIESDTGLTDATIAHQPLLKRGRVGHEKHASVDYLVANRRAHFLFAPWGYDLLHLEDHIPLRAVDLDSVSGWILHWDPEMMRALKARGARFTDFTEELDGYIAHIDDVPLEQLKRDYAKFKLYYFDRTPDPKREQRFRRRLEPR